ncbi:MAG: metalloregulator ArsR/SmtB family transcription factor [Pseudomonadota bacterium]
MNEERALAALSALAQQTRLSVFRLLISAGSDGLAAGEIAQRVGARPNTLSTHLQALLMAGLVSRERKGRSIVYRAHFGEVSKLLTFLMQEACGGEEQIWQPVKQAMDSPAASPALCHPV